MVHISTVAKADVRELQERAQRTESDEDTDERDQIFKKRWHTCINQRERDHTAKRERDGRKLRNLSMWLVASIDDY